MSAVPAIAVAEAPISVPSFEEIANFLQSYCDCIDSEQFDQWCDFFTDDARYRLTTAENLRAGYPLSLIDCMGKRMMRDRIVGLESANVFEPHTYRHLLSLPRVMASGSDVVRVKTGFMIARTMEGGVSSLFLTGYYDDLIVRVGETLKFSSRLAVLDASLIDSLIVVPV